MILKQFYLKAVLAACLTIAFVPVVSAQPAVAVPAPSTVQFMSAYDFHLTAAGLANDDERFVFDTYWGGDLDLVDYVWGRASILIDYEAVLGSEYRPFDPNQSYYLLEASSSVRAGATEMALVFHHVSRHLSDRPKRFSIAWNVLQARAMRRFAVGGSTVEARADLGKLTQHSWVDYTWTADLDLLVRRPINGHVGTFARAYGEAFGVDRRTLNRGTKTGGRLEGGVRLTGRRGSLELVAGYEGRVDADPINRVPMRWVFAGFRLVSN